jgi:hypothetical protein
LQVLTGVARYVARLAVAALMVAAVGLGVPAPAQASTCGRATGVSVVVDFNELGGGVRTFCDAGGAGRTAFAQLKDAGYDLTPVQRQPAFICRIDGKPADDPCVNTPPADAYWSLWWSDGKSGTWSYSSAGASSLTVPEGGYVGMSWQSGDGKSPPGATPTAHADSPSSGPTTHPTSSPRPSSGPSRTSPTSGAPGVTSSASGTATPATQEAGGHGKQHVDPSKVGRAPGKATHAPNQTQAGDPLGGVTPGGTDDAGGSGSGGVPGWVAPVAIVVLFLGAGAIVLLRRRTSDSP